MAIADLWQAATFNRPGYDLYDYDVYALAGDGCLMEGIGAEAASPAGHQQLSDLCWIGSGPTSRPRPRTASMSPTSNPRIGADGDPLGTNAAGGSLGRATWM